METTMFFGLITTSHPIEAAYTIGALAVAVAYFIGAVGGLIAYGVFHIATVIVKELVVRTKAGQWLSAKLFQLKQLAS